MSSYFGGAAADYKVYSSIAADMRTENQNREAQTFLLYL